MASRDETSFYKALGASVRRVRRERKLSQRALCKLAGLSVGFLSGLENGDRGVSAYNLVRICKALRYPIQDAILASGYRYVATPFG